MQGCQVAEGVKMMKIERLVVMIDLKISFSLAPQEVLL